MILIRKTYLLVFFGAVSLLGTTTPMSLDDLYKGLLEDIEKNQPTQESLEMLKKHKNALSHQYRGKQVIVFFAHEMAECAKQYRELERQNSQAIADIERLMKLGGKLDALRATFEGFIERGKGDPDFEKEVPGIIAELEKNKKLYGSALGTLKYAFPQLYPESDEPEEELVDDEPIKDSFVYVAPPTDLALAASRFCAKWKELKKEHTNYYRPYNYRLPVIDSDLLQTDLAGQTLLVRAAHWWRDADDSRYGSNKANRKALFRDILDRGRSIDQFEHRLPVVMDLFLADEVGYADLLNELERYFPGRFEAHKVLRTQTPAVKEQPSPQKLSAFHVAELLMNFYLGDDQLSNFLSLIKERPGLVHACEPGGLSLLRLILRAYDRAHSDKRKTMLLRLFDMLLLMGADPTKKFRIPKRIYEYQNGSFVYVIREVDAPSVEEILNDFRKDADASAYLPDHPYRNRTSYSLAIGQSTATTCKARLDAWKAGTTARLEGNTGEWLREHLPPKPVVLTKEQKAERRKEQRAFEKEQQKLMEQQLNQKPSPVKAFIDRWKGTFGYFLAGATVTGVGYWLWKNYSTDQSLEDIRQERQRARAARALMKAS